MSALSVGETAGARTPQRLVGAALAFGLLLYFLFVAALIYGEGHSDALDQSDAIQPFMVMRDMLRDPSAALDWKYPIALLVFPDWIIAGVLLATPLTLQMMPLACAALLFTGYAAAAGLLIRRCTPLPWTTATLLAALAITALVASSYPPRTLGDSIVQHMGHVYFHTGTLLVGLCVLALFAEFIVQLHERERWPPSLSGACILAALGAWGDPFVLFWFVLPGVVAVACYLAVSGVRPPVWRMLALLFSAVAGILIDRYSRTFTVEAGMSPLPVVWHAWSQFIVDSFRGHDWPVVRVVPLIAAMVLRVLWIARAARRRRRPQAMELGEILLIACTWASLLFPLLSGTFVHQDNLRYSLPVFLLPYLWLLLVAVNLLPFPRLMLAAALAAWLAIAVSFAPRALAGAKFFAGPRGLAACLISHDLHEGYADYWLSKSVMWNSGYRVHIVQVTQSDGAYRAYLYNFNSRWLRTNAETGAPLAPTFIDTARLDKVVLRHQFGTASRTMECGDDEIWVYDKPLALVD